MKKSALREFISIRISENTDKLYRLAYSYVKNEEDAMDIVQDTAYKLLKNSASIRSPEYIDTWLYRVAVNTSIDFLRKRKRERVGLPETEEGAGDNYDRIDLLDALNCLDERSRSIVILHYFEDKTLQQIAGILDENLSTVKTRLYAALRVLKKNFSSEEGVRRHV